MEINSGHNQKDLVMFMIFSRASCFFLIMLPSWSMKVCLAIFPATSLSTRVPWNIPSLLHDTEQPLHYLAVLQVSEDLVLLLYLPHLIPQLRAHCLHCLLQLCYGSSLCLVLSQRQQQSVLSEPQQYSLLSPAIFLMAAWNPELSLLALSLSRASSNEWQSWDLLSWREATFSQYPATFNGFPL